MSARATDTVVVERDIPYPPEKIWRALTQPHLIEEWLMQNDFKPEVGHQFTLRRQPQPDVAIEIDCEVLAVEPERTLSYSWSYANPDPAYELRSVVTLTLIPTEDGGTRLRVEQSGFRPDQRQAFKGANAGWRQFLAALEQALARMDRPE